MDKNITFNASFPRNSFKHIGGMYALHLCNVYCLGEHMLQTYAMCIVWNWEGWRGPCISFYSCFATGKFCVYNDLICTVDSSCSLMWKSLLILSYTSPDVCNTAITNYRSLPSIFFIREVIGLHLIVKRSIWPWLCISVLGDET